MVTHSALLAAICLAQTGPEPIADPLLDAPVEIQAPALDPKPNVTVALRVAILDVAIAEASPRQGSLFEQALRAEVGKYEGVVVVDPDTGARPDNAACPPEKPACLARLAEQLGADAVVTAKATRLGSARILTLKRLNIHTAEITAAVSKQISGGGDAYLLTLGDAVGELFTDHRMREAAPLGVPLSVARRWEPKPVAPWMFWSGVGATAVSLGSGMAYGIMARNDSGDYNRLARKGQLVDGQTLRRLDVRAHDHATTANVAYGVAALCAIGTAVAWAFTDWGSDAQALPNLSAWQRSEP